MSTTLVAIVAAVAALLVFSGVVLLLVWTLFGTKVAFCNTECCITHAKTLNAAMDTSVNPCDNFYRYTCGSWVRNARDPSMIRHIFSESARIAVAEMENTADPVIPAAVMYYQSCVKPRTQDDLKSGIDAFKVFKQEMGLMWPEKEQDNRTHPLMLLLNMSINWNYHMFFQLRAFPKYRGRPATLYIRRGRLNRNWQDVPLEEFMASVRQHCAVLETPAPSNSHLTEVYGAVRDMIGKSLSAAPGTTNERKIPLKETLTHMPFTSRLLAEYVNELHHPDFSWNDESPLFVEDTKILSSLDELLSDFNTSVSLLLRGCAWVFIRDNLWVVAGMPNLRHKGNAGVLQTGLRTACLRFVEESFGLVIMAKHVRTRYNEALRGTLVRIFNTTGVQVMKAVNDSDWIASAIKLMVNSKVAAVGLNAMPGEQFFAREGLTSLYRNFSTNASASFMQNYIIFSKAYRRIIGLDEFIEVYSKRQSGNAPSRYNYYYNIAFLSLGALEPPILYSGASLAMTYGSVGALIAECMVRSFDTHGVLVDDKGESAVWWGLDWAEYKARVECDLLSDANIGISSQEQRERLSSALFPLPPALAASFGALRKAAADRTQEYQNAGDVRLQGLDKHTDSQVFFLTYCLMTCSTDPSDAIRCNVPLQHTPAFAQAFQCPAGSRMNPREKCLFLA